ncbi:MAG: glycogen-binding domain-containing protein, partial [Ferruginibacter sp.]
MEVKSTIPAAKNLVRFCFYVCVFIFCNQIIDAQTPPKYSVKNGEMYIELSRKMNKASLDSFVAKFDLSDLHLEQFIKKNNADVLLELGWHIAANNDRYIIISKPFKAYDKINNAAERILFAEKHPTLAERFPAVNNGILFGANRFRNKSAFDIKDSVVTFYLRNNLQASKVMLAGSFNNWVPDALPMTKTDSGWIAKVTLGAGKYWYKFIADDGWMVDNDNLLKENDGQGNTNSIFYKPSYIFRLKGFTNAEKVFVAGSFNG